MLRVFSALLLLYAVFGYSDWNCPSNIAPADRVDCYPEGGSSESGCNSRGCMWCENYDSGLNVPWCFYDDTTTSEPPSCLPDEQRVDCYPEAGSSEQGCYDRGCEWCVSQQQGYPWCYYGEGYTAPPSTDGCATTIPESQRVDCWPGGGATESNCENAGCIWCESNTNGVPWCFFNTTDMPEGIPDEERVNCIPEGGFNPSTCADRGCVYASTTDPAAPMCYFPDNAGYVMSQAPVATSNGYRVYLTKSDPSTTVFGNDVLDVTLDVTYDTNERIHFKFYDGSATRWEVPLTVEGHDPSANSANNLYEINFYNDPSFYMQIVRKSTGTIIFDTSLGGLTFSDQFLQLATRVPQNAAVYGFGENEHQTFKHQFAWEDWGMYARDQPPDPGANLYGTHPFHIAIEEDYNSHGVFFLNSNAQDITFTPAPGLVYRTTGGVLDFYVFLGPEPKKVIEQYNQAIGKPFLPPYWSLGFQLCRYGYNDLQTVQGVVSRMQAAQIPQDVQYGDIDYMDEQRDFTYDTVAYNGLPDWVRELQSTGMHYVIILDPCITVDDPPGTYPAYDLGTAQNVFIMDSDNSAEALGKVWPPGNCAFPDYSAPQTIKWWSEQCVDFHGVIPFDGLWIDMNEPANFVGGSVNGCNQNSINNPPFVPAIWGGSLYDKTLCPDFHEYYGLHYDTHNLYGWYESNATIVAAVDSTGRRPFVISRSTFPGSGKWSAHWLGDNNSDWHDLRMSIIGMLEFNLFGIPYVGADICGFNGNCNEELCDRWMELGAFYPYARNHNGLGYPAQDPTAFGSAFEQRSKAVLEHRYTLLPYLYTLFYYANVDGAGVVRPLAFEFNDQVTLSIDQQFMWGGGLLISPVLYQGADTVDAYFPDARWYSYYDGSETPARMSTESLYAPIGTIPLHVRGGHILPTQDHAVNTELSRLNPMGLVIALDDNGSAHGDLYWDYGDTLNPIENGDFNLLHFDVSSRTLTTTVDNYNSQMGCSSSSNYCMVLGSFKIFGFGSPSTIYVNGSPVSATFNNNAAFVDGINVPMTSGLTITW